MSPLLGSSRILGTATAWMPSIGSGVRCFSFRGGESPDDQFGVFAECNIERPARDTRLGSRASRAVRALSATFQQGTSLLSTKEAPVKV